MNIFRSAPRTLIAAVAAIILAPQLAISAEHRGDFAPDKMAWKLTVRPERIDKYLNFPASQIGSLTRIAVYFESTEKDSKPIHYKNYYYNKGKPIGSKQVQAVTFPPDTRGPIMVKSSTNHTDAETAAAANVTVRLFLDLYTSKNFPQFIIVDDKIFSDFIAATRNEGFTPFNLPLSRDVRPKPKAIMVLKSDVGEKFQHLMYQ